MLSMEFPPRIVGVMQHALKRMPEECPHCGARGNALLRDGRLCECILCGYTGYLTEGTVEVSGAPTGTRRGRKRQ